MVTASACSDYGWGNRVEDKELFRIMMIKQAKSTLTPFELDWGETLQFVRADGHKVTFHLLKTWSEVVSTGLNSFDTPVSGAKTVYRFFCDMEINKKQYRFEREIPTQKSFYDPWTIDGVFIWFDAVSDIFKTDNGFLLEKDAIRGQPCKPDKKARFAVADVTLDICPEKLHPWFPLPDHGLSIEACYRGEDCWMGPYDGMMAHGGLDINHPVGTPLWVPFDLDDQFYFNSLKMGDNNNRWRGIRQWDDGTVWVIQAHHMTELTVQEHMPLKKGEQFAKGAGVFSGVVDHTHFVFRVDEDGKTFFLDPWILIWKMYRDLKG